MGAAGLATSPAKVDALLTQVDAQAIQPASAETVQAQQESAPGEESATSAASEPRGTVQYEVAPGDTISTIAEQFDISTETLLWANKLANADFIKLGQTLVIPPITGLVHTVQKGDTLLSIAIQYDVSTEDIVGYGPNQIINQDALSIGQELVIPGGTIPSSRPAPSSRGGARPATSSAPAPAAAAAVAPPSGSFAWPNRGLLTQYFSSYHDGLDIASPYGTPIAAADGGVVIVEQRLDWGLGWHIILDHGNGYTTTYGHMSRFAVSPGERVSKGEIIGYVGSTGLSTGPHNHFIIRRNGVPVNPLNYLP